jgi:hypothetical protein
MIRNYLIYRIRNAYETNCTSFRSLTAAPSPCKFGFRSTSSTKKLVVVRYLAQRAGGLGDSYLRQAQAFITQARQADPAPSST